MNLGKCTGFQMAHPTKNFSAVIEDTTRGYMLDKIVYK